jgi:hypothetical protein
MGKVILEKNRKNGQPFLVFGPDPPVVIKTCEVKKATAARFIIR